MTMTELFRPKRMRFGVFLAPFHRVGENPTLALDRDVALIEHLDSLGFDEAWVGEHHSAGWELIADPTIYNNKVVNKLYVYKKQLFIVTENDLIRSKIKKGFSRTYDYKFIGRINDIFVENNDLWLATNNGLIQFKWKKDL